MCSVKEVRAAADAAHVAHAGAHAALLAAIAELGSSGAWRGDGAGDLASWLCARWQVSKATARSWVRQAKTLSARPALADALSDGGISVDQCRALTTLSEAGTGDDEVWLEVLPFWSIHDLEREARKKTARELERTDDGVYLRMRHTPDERYLRGEFQLHPDDGATVLGTIDSLVPKSTPLRDWDHASALALVELAKGGGNEKAGRPTVLVSVPHDALAGKAGAETVARLGSGGYVGVETARRLACDARIQELSLDGRGTIVATGRTSSGVSPAMRRAVSERDGGVCAFPGCGRDAFLEVHHIVHRAHGGATVLPNLLLLCWTHHTLIHEDAWSVCGEPGAGLRWIRPDGSPFEPRVRVSLDTS